MKSQTTNPPKILDRFTKTQNNISKAVTRYQRCPEDVQLIAVSKSFDTKTIRPVLEQGHRIFGENRIQETKNKWPALRKKYSNIELHLIGPLQSNKVKDAILLFDVIETIDREKIANLVAAEMEEQNKTCRLLVQVNTGEEVQKAGVKPTEVTEFVQYCQHDLKLNIEGLMCIPPIKDSAAPHFALLQQLAIRLNLPTLSMGMSHDFDIAIMLGATYIRLGTAIFGARS